MLRILRQVSIAAVVMLVAAGLVPKAEAALVQIGSFESTSGLYTYNDGSLTGTTGGNFTFDPAFAAMFGLPMSTFTNAQLEVNATATGSATSGGVPTTISQEMAGYIIVTDLDSGDVLLRVDFTDSFLTGVEGGQSVSLIGGTGFGSGITYTSDVFDETQVMPPHEFRFALNPTSTPNAISGDNFANFTAPDIADFSTTVVVPEPASLTLFGLGLTAVGVLARRRRRQ